MHALCRITLSPLLLALATTGSSIVAQISCHPITYFDPPVGASITQAAQLDCYRFPGVPGEKVRVHMTWGGIAMYAEILDPAGTVLAAACNNIMMDCTLTGAGPQTYRLRIRDCDSWRTGRYNFSLHRLDTTEGSRDVYYTSPRSIPGTIDSGADVRRYRLTAQASKVVQFVCAWGGIAMAVEVLDASGARVDYFENQTVRNVTLPASGVYSVHVRDNELWRTGWYSFSLSCLSFPCDGVAAWRNFGSGWPGTGGVIPSLRANAPPRLGSQIQIRVGNSSGRATTVVTLGSLSDTNVASPFGGRVLVFLDSILTFPMPAGGLTIPFSIPLDSNLADVAIHLQAVQGDSGASRGISFTPGLTLVLGQ